MTGESATTPPGPPATASVPLPGRPGTAPRTGPGASTADRSGRPARLPSLTVLRFPASLAVLVCHIYEFIWPERVWSGDLADDLLHHAAYLGVALFFLLSGFVLTWAAREGDSARSLWRRRVVRVFPGHTVVWVIGAVLLLGSGGTLGVAAALELPLLHAWAFGPLDEFLVVSGVTWSLSCEVLFYLSFPLVVRLVRRLPRHRLALCAALLCALVVAFPVVARVLLPGTPLYGEFPVSRQQFWFVQVLPLTRFAEFLLGVILARTVAERVCPAIRLRYALVAVAASLALSLHLPFLFAFTAAWVIPLSLLIVACAQADLRRGPTRPNWGPALWLGETSYALFLVHLFVVQYLCVALVAPGPGMPQAHRWTWAVLMVFASVLAAWLLHITVERPAMRRWSHPRRRTPDKARP